MSSAVASLNNAPARQKMKPFMMPAKSEPPRLSGWQEFLAATKERLFAKPWLKREGGIAVIVEPRIVPEMEYVLRNINYFTEGWKIVWFHGRKNASYAKELATKLPGLQLIALPVDDLRNNYNELLASASFWRQVPAENVLVFQTDALLLRKGIDDFLAYDYVGAPWHFGGFGNGGLSFRHKSKMLAVLRRTPYQASLGNEDVFFVKQLQAMAGTKLPTVAEAGQFSVETVFYPRPLGVHNAWNYLPADQVAKLLRPEIYD